MIAIGLSEGSAMVSDSGFSSSEISAFGVFDYSGS